MQKSCKNRKIYLVNDVKITTIETVIELPSPNYDIPF